nr:unnamed protein product [Callosobruchus analis]
MALEIGMTAMDKIVGKTFSELTFSRKDRVLPLSAVHSSVKTADTVVPINPVLIYQRISFAKQSQEQLKEYFQYELSPYALSLFDDSGMRKGIKSALMNLFSLPKYAVIYVM